MYVQEATDLLIKSKYVGRRRRRGGEGRGGGQTEGRGEVLGTEL